MAWVAPKTDWASTDGVTTTDLNRIEGNIDVMAGTGYDGTFSLKSLYDDLYEAGTGHMVAAAAEKDEIHDTLEETRTNTNIRLSVEVTSQNSGHSDGDIWLYTGE